LGVAHLWCKEHVRNPTVTLTRPYAYLDKIVESVKLEKQLKVTVFWKKNNLKTM